VLHGGIVVGVACAYLGLLFAIAWYADRRADAGRSIIANPYIYALSLGVYATSWTFYGSVGRAASDGVGFLPIYIGPTLMVALWWIVLRKMLRIAKAHRITSLADFVASRYGKSALLAGLVTVIAVIGIVPYISLQLKAVSGSFRLLLQYPQLVDPSQSGRVAVWGDTAFYAALGLALFTIVFGTRHLDAAERHEGMVAAIAFESLVKLVAFLAVGAFVTFGMYGGFADVFGRAAAVPHLAALLAPLDGAAGSYASWVWLTILSMMAILFLPRQFQVAVVENVEEDHLRKAIWLFPLYMLAINVFVLPIAFGGSLRFPGGGVDPDTFVLTLPLAEGRHGLALLVFIGGLSAAAGMVIVETIALSTMVCNDLVMPMLLRVRGLRLNEREDLSGLLLAIRRGAIVMLLLLGYVYFRLAGEAYALVSIGLISFAAVAQFAPAILGGMFWKGATRAGALTGLCAGFLVWVYTLLAPAFARSGWLPARLLDEGPFGLALLRPLQLFGLAGLDPITHAMLWTLLANCGAYIGVSLLGRPSAIETRQAALFVDAFALPRPPQGTRAWRGSASMDELEQLLGRYLGPARAAEAFRAHARVRGGSPRAGAQADADLVHRVETQLAGALGAATARVLVAAVVKDEELGRDQVLGMLDEASQVLAYSHRLEQKSRALEQATGELRAANERLRELDRLKDDFVSTVSHELRTPLTSIRLFSEIMHDHPELDPAERKRHAGVIIKESERLTRLIEQVLDLSKIESGHAEWHVEEIDLREVIEDAASASARLFAEKGARLALELPPAVPRVRADRDRLMQVMLNLLSNAAKFSPEARGQVVVRLAHEGAALRVDVRDNGPGIRLEDQALIFEKFRQAGDTLTEKPQGTGLGLPISREIVGHFGGVLWVESTYGEGAVFSFSLPLAGAGPSPR
jgi:Na+/proline symporter/signal transduction histidine kinase